MPSYKPNQDQENEIAIRSLIKTVNLKNAASQFSTPSLTLTMPEPYKRDYTVLKPTPNYQGLHGSYSPVRNAYGAQMTPYTHTLNYRTESANYDDKSQHSQNGQDEEELLFKYNRQKNQHSEFYQSLKDYEKV